MVHMTGMQGITNSQIREKFETLEKEIQEIKQMRQRGIDQTFLSLAAIISLVATLMFAFTSQSILLFFIIFGISTMIFFILKIIYQMVRKQQ